MGRIENKYIGYGIFTILIFLLLISITVTVSAEQNTNLLNKNDTNSTYQHKQNDTCSNCHNSSHVQQAGRQQQKNVKQTGKVSPTTGKAGTGTTGTLSTRGVTTSVTGNITLISSMGQNWYQQGIFGPDGYNIRDQSWGWTFFDENPPTGYIIPTENIIQRDNIFALLLDDGNNSIPITGATVVADVTYWKYNNISYTSNVTSVQLAEEPNRLGFYSGRFDFYGGSPQDSGCMFCHKTMFGGSDTLNGYFPGNYTVTVRADASGKTMNKNLNFQVTTWGCEDCHGSGNRHRSSGPDRHIVSADMDSACYACHGLNDLTGMYEPGNPHQNIAHRNINCVDCHTNKGLQNGTFNGVTFVNGGFNNAPLPQYNYNVVQLNGGTHTGLSCSDCHGNLTLQDIGGGYDSGGYVVNDTINKYNPNFTSIESFQDYYVVDVTGEGPLNINFDWLGTANLGFFVYPPNFNPRNYTNLEYYDGSTSNKPETYTNNAPMVGKWIVQLYGYNFRSDWTGELQPPINYTISSTYPLQKKGLPTTPECNSCHNSGATGGEYTKDTIPDWNPGYAHADVNGDGTLDVQCRMCHDSTHNIGVKKCQDCHTKAPIGHIITGTAYYQYNTTKCLQCHGDPHKVSAQAEQCIECHGTNYTGIAPSVDSTFVDIGRFNGSVHQNINSSVPLGNVTNDDCHSCHYNIDMNRQNIRKCNYCHSKPSQWHGNANVTTNLTALAQK